MDSVMPFSQALRSATASAHSSAESHAFITSLMSGELDERAYADLTLQLYPVYEAMERRLAEVADDALLADFADERLNRTASLDADLAFFYGSDWREQVERGELSYTPATLAYVAELEKASVQALLANHYVRYLGDLSGGLAIRALVQRHYRLPDEAVSFYEFGEIRPKVYKDVYRAKLDAVALDDLGKRAVLQQAERAFALNEALFAELGHHVDRVAALAG